MDIYSFLSTVFAAFMGFGFLAVGASFMNWNNPAGQAAVGFFIFLVGCMFTTIWALSVLRMALKLYG